MWKKIPFLAAERFFFQISGEHVAPPKNDGGEHMAEEGKFESGTSTSFHQSGRSGGPHGGVYETEEVRLNQHDPNELYDDHDEYDDGAGGGELNRRRRVRRQTGMHG